MTTLHRICGTCGEWFATANIDQTICEGCLDDDDGGLFGHPWEQDDHF